jgi:hypothetical protein
MRGFLAIAVSVKDGMTIWVKRDSLSFKGSWNYKRGLEGPDFGLAGSGDGVLSRQWKQNDASI